ncbi:G5 domain-containing protein [Helcococcus sueciensis]|uniref:G5 domain-containing protein n=1 Tax=Helcococcus sueciensis TaxID=241555 RepID=UPI00041DAF27|nr:G5 domain-containing protein [Helcococcus sueciensis]
MSFIKNNKNAIIGVLTLTTSIFVGEMALANVPKTINLSVDNNEITEIETSSKNVEDLLNELGYKIDEIKISTNLDDTIRNNYKLDINTKKTITFNNEGNNLMVNTYATNVKDFLDELSIKYDSDDIINPSLDSNIKNGEKISYDNVVTEDYTETKEIEFKKESKYSFDLDYGKKEIEVKGENGKKVLHKSKTFINSKIVSDEVVKETVTKKPINQVTLIGTKEVVEESTEPELIEKENSSLYEGETNVLQSGSEGLVRYTYENNGSERKLVEEKILKKSVDRIVEYGTKSRPVASSTSGIYSLSDLTFHGVINWGGYKFTYYSQSVLPGGGLNIPGRHVNAGGFVADGDGYIVIANSAPIGTIINTPFGYQGKVYDRGTYGNHMDVYTR